MNLSIGCSPCILIYKTVYNRKLKNNFHAPYTALCFDKSKIQLENLQTQVY